MSNQSLYERNVKALEEQAVQTKKIADGVGCLLILALWACLALCVLIWRL